MKRWREQRWILDNVIRANGVDWDQPRTVYLAAPCGLQAAPDFEIIRQRVKKFDDCASEFEGAARRREANAKAAQAEGHLVTAREHYFTAAILWGAAQWPLDENSEHNLFNNGRKRECYRRYAELAAHPVEEVWIPFRDAALPAWLHLPPQSAGEPVPVVVSIPGMDSLKESGVAMYGDRFLCRGCAVLAVDGPGQYESPTLGIYMSVEAWDATGRAIMEWIKSQSRLDAGRAALSGTSFGTFAATIAGAGEPRFKACAANAVLHEPGFRTLFEEASPTFKKRFMYMSNIADEEAFDRFAAQLTWEGRAGRIEMPYLAMAGEHDELSPLVWTERLLAELGGPKQLVVYKGSRHAIAGPPAIFGPNPLTLAADWLADRLADRPMASERWFVPDNGVVEKSPLA
jgi:dienelactone hydrolase